MESTHEFLLELASIVVGGVAVVIVLVTYWFWRSRDKLKGS